MTPKRCAVCESEKITAMQLTTPIHFVRWNLLLADQVVYCCTNGHWFLILPDVSEFEH